MMPLVSAILLNWRRPYHLPRIVDSLCRHDFIHQIIIWNNSGTTLLKIDDSHSRCPVYVFNSIENFCTYGRFKAVWLASHDIIYTQDDDVIVKNVGFLYRRFLEHQTSITAGLPDGHFRYEANKKPWLQLGWGSFHRRDWFNCIIPYIQHYGEDEILKRKFDRIYTCMYGGHDPQHADIERLQRDGKDSDRDENSLWLREDHIALTEIAVARVEALKCKLAES